MPDEEPVAIVIGRVEVDVVHHPLRSILIASGTSFRGGSNEDSRTPTVGFVSIDRFLQNRAPVFGLPFGLIGPGIPA